jgi:plastocyanin
LAKGEGAGIAMARLKTLLALVTMTLALASASGLYAHAADPEIVITIKDRHFVPNDVPFPAGQKVKLVVKNEDATTSEFESVDFHREKVVQSGGEITVFIGPLDPGTYEFFDDFHPETRGHLVVK